MELLALCSFLFLGTGEKKEGMGKWINGQSFQQLVTNANVEVIEVKYALDRVVLGEVIIGADLLEMDYSPNKVKHFVICEVGDPVLEKVCEKRNIKVWIPAQEY